MPRPVLVADRDARIRLVVVKLLVLVVVNGRGGQALRSEPRALLPRGLAVPGEDSRHAHGLKRETQAFAHVLLTTNMDNKQVQYAERAAKRGSPVVALTNGRDAVAICAERRRRSRLEDFVSVEKLAQVQGQGRGSVALTSNSNGGGVCYLGVAGLAADGRRLLDKTRLFAENYRLRHAEDPAVKELAHFIAGEPSCARVFAWMVG